VSQPLAQLVTGPQGASRRGLPAMLGAVALVMLLAAPVLAAMGPTKLEEPSVTPTVGTPATTIVAEVTYRNHRDRAPEYVRVVVGGSVHDMAASDPLDWRAGVRFRWSGMLPVGTYEISFEAKDWEKFVDVLVAGTVTIEPPPPAPTPTPPPAPDPDPAPGPSDDPAPASPPDGGSGEPDELGAGSTAGDSGSGVGPRREHGSSFTEESGDPDGSSGGSPVGGGVTGGGGGRGSAEPGGSGGSSGSGGSGAGDGSGGGAFAVIGEFLRDAGVDPLAVLLPGNGGNTLPTLAAAVGSLAAVGVWMAFSLFGKRRRDEQPPAPDDVLRAAAASGSGLVAASSLVPEIDDPERFMPRWRRPSLLQARKHDPIRDGLPERQALAFGVDMATTNERRLIRYATVRLLDRPDEVMGLAVGDLAAGDEVELCERSSLFWFVRTPDGRAGWLHRMTLGDSVGGNGATGNGATSNGAAGNGATSNGAAHSDDGFSAVLAARGLR